MSDAGSTGRVEEYDARGSFALRVTQRGYEIWDRRVATGPISLFPGTDEGLEAAELVFQRLVREERMDRDRWSTGFRWTLFIALGVWVASSIARAIVEFLLIARHGGSSFIWWLDSSAAVQDVSFAAWMAALVVLVALWLRRNGRVVEQRLMGTEQAREVPGATIEE